MQKNLNSSNQSQVEAWGKDHDRFIMIFDDVWEVLKGTSALSVYMALKRRVQGEGSTWYSTRSALAKESGVSLKTFDRGMDTLEELGLAQSVERFVPKDWDRKDTSKISQTRDDVHCVQIGNLYRVRFRTVGNFDQPPSSKRPDPLGKFDQPPSSNLHNRHRYQDIDTKTNKPPISPKGGETRFDEFWNIYDKKVAVSVARKRYKQALKKVDEDTLIEAARKYVQSQKAVGKHPQFTANPSTWLNQERWNDELEPVVVFDDLSFDDEERPF